MTFKLAVKFLFKAYVVLTALVGTVVISEAYFYKRYSDFVPQNIPVPLGNGFVYTTNPDFGRSDKVLVDAQGVLVVYGSIRSLAVEGNTVYGYRDPVLSDAFFYFICTYGENCTESQDYDDVTFKNLLAARGLPPFTGWRVKSRRWLTTMAWLERTVTGSTYRVSGEGGGNE